MTHFRLSINGAKEVLHAHTDVRFKHVAHVFHLEWHGIRSATSCLPGHKIGISADQNIDGDALRRLTAFIYEEDIQCIVFQGYSKNADLLSRVVTRTFGGKVVQCVVTHLTSTQLENFFEIEMQKLILQAYSEKIFFRIGSVKPHFNSVVGAYWNKLIVNCSPNIRFAYRHEVVQPGYAFVPLENTIRKNLYTNVIAALNSKKLAGVLTVNEPSGLQYMIDTGRVRVIGFQRGRQLYERMADAALVLNCTLAECQPMTHLEALAVGTPCLTGSLGIDEFRDHDLTKLTEVIRVDDPSAITRQIDDLVEMQESHSDELRSLIAEYLAYRNKLSVDRLSEFLGA